MAETPTDLAGESPLRVRPAAGRAADGDIQAELACDAADAGRRISSPLCRAIPPGAGEIWPAGGGHLRVLLSDLLFPCPPASAGLLAEIDGFFGAGSATPRLARVLADRRDMVGQALRSRALRG